MRALVVGIGGGGDVAAAYCVSLYLRKLGYETIVGSIVWERLIRDPLPGPIGLDELENCEMRAHYCIADGDEYAIRGNKKVVPQATKLASATGLKVLVFDLKKGFEGLIKGLEEAIREYGIEAVYAVDAGGDVLAKPSDDEVWSPLADSLGLAALKELKAKEKVLAVFGPGCDGELPQEKVLERISEVWRKGGNMGGFVLSKTCAEECLRVVNAMDTEASKMAILAALGEYGERRIRRGARRLFLSPITATTFFLDPNVIESEMCEAVKGTKSIEEASLKLNEICVYTELDFERDLVTNESEDFLKVREEGMKRIRERCRRAPSP